MDFRVKAKNVDDIQILMVKKGLLKTTLAEKAKVHPNTLTKLFQNKLIMPLSAKRISDVLDINESNYEDFFIIENISKS